jgi:hypothetical protein
MQQHPLSRPPDPTADARQVVIVLGSADIAFKAEDPLIILPVIADVNSTPEQAVVFKRRQSCRTTAASATSSATSSATATSAAVSAITAVTAITAIAPVPADAGLAGARNNVVDSIAVGEQSAAIQTEMESTPVGNRFFQSSAPEVIGEPGTQSEETIFLVVMNAVIKSFDADTCCAGKFELHADTRNGAHLVTVPVVEIGHHRVIARAAAIAGVAILTRTSGRAARA